MLDNILGNLTKYKKVGEGKYRAPCPVHDGKDNNLMISESPDGKIGCHCFVCGANGLDVVGALGLSPAELFPPEDKYERPVVTKKMIEQLTQDKLIVMMYESDSGSKSLADRRRYRQAKARIAGIEEKIEAAQSA